MENGIVQLIGRASGTAGQPDPEVLERVGGIILEYLEEVRNGRKPNVAAYIARLPEGDHELARKCFGLNAMLMAAGATTPWPGD